MVHRLCAGPLCKGEFPSLSTLFSSLSDSFKKVILLSFPYCKLMPFFAEVEKGEWHPVIWEKDSLVFKPLD